MGRMLWVHLRIKFRRAMIPVWRALLFWNAHHSYEDGRGYRSVSVDGVELPKCKECNLKEGWAIVYAEPMVIVDDELQTETVYGKVTIKYV
jgi:hypothetical protein